MLDKDFHCQGLFPKDDMHFAGSFAPPPFGTATHLDIVCTPIYDLHYRTNWCFIRYNIVLA
jgi:hypothetical protein